jgi:hypothetical protein
VSARAAGIGSTLLRLHRHLSGDPWTVRWPHAPDWTQRQPKNRFAGARVQLGEGQEGRNQIDA